LDKRVRKIIKKEELYLNFLKIKLLKQLRTLDAYVLVRRIIFTLRKIFSIESLKAS